MDRRSFLMTTAASALGATALGRAAMAASAKRAANSAYGLSLVNPYFETTGPMPVRGIIPVVGDGKWIWTEPPQDKRGYLEPRLFSLRLGIEMEGTGNATEIKATTTAPGEFPEQKIEEVELETHGCQADLVKVGEGAAVLGMQAAGIRRGQRIAAYANYKLTISKQYDGFEPGQFPAEQPEPPREIARGYLGISPGIQTKHRSVLALSQELATGLEHPWEKAEAFYKWVWDNIEPHRQNYTSVIAAIDKKIGDCEEKSTVFVALARAAGLPARLVWVPNHNWCELYLTDYEGDGHWVPVHTSAYSWFGWTGAHELVIQKGDRHRVPYRTQSFRLIPDWARWVGAKPNIRWTAKLKPEPPEQGEDPGPGARQKDAKGEWLVVGEHEMNRYMRK